ncbi:MAG: hypothetical protein SVG88_01145 [Halobacteriales archaeon]|nr:hypothetical protein [Halobacteriales archaeon]
MADEGYSGLIGAFRFAFRRSDSRFFQSYVLISALLGLFVGLLLVLGLTTWMANPTGLIGEKALLAVLGLLFVGPLFAPVLLVARRYRRDSSTTAHDRLFALAGYGFVLAVYLGLFITDPNEHAATGMIATLDRLPRIYGLVPPVAAALGIALVSYATRSSDDEPTEVSA